MQSMQLLDGRASPGVDTWVLFGSGQDTPSSFTFPPASAAVPSGAVIADWNAAPQVEYDLGDNTASLRDLTALPRQWQCTHEQDRRAATAKVDGYGKQTAISIPIPRVSLHHLKGVRHDLTTRDMEALALLEAALRNVSNKSPSREA